ncbi:MAG TPA: thioredoxin domain-containing protein [Anaerolineaceae bacterium]|nr:thioredoxin domain-containing protein [Anaerolineaceae bacterium]
MGSISLAENRRTLTILAIIILAALAAFYFTRSKPASIVPAPLAQDPAIGPANAPVTIVEYGDFGCTTCLGWERAGVRSQILANYNGKVRFIWRDFPVITAQSPKAAEAAQCAFLQGKFWPYHDLLYQKAPALSTSNLKQYAADLGLDTIKFNHCLDSGQEQAKVTASMQAAYKLNFVGTPSFTVNNQPVVGPQSYSYFSSMIAKILSING